MRLKSEIWVKGYLRTQRADNIMAVLSRRGDADAGAIYILVDLMNGRACLYGPAPAGLDVVDRERRWIACFTTMDVALSEAQEYLARQLDMDPDIWVVEVEDGDGQHFLGDAVVSD